MQNVRWEDTEKSQCPRSENSPKRSSIQRQNLLTGCSQSNNISSAQREHINLSQHTGNDIAGDQEEIVKGSKKDAKKHSDNTDSMDISLTKCRGEDSCDVVEMQRTSKASLLQWTDEQLDQLFDEDDASLFS